MGSQFDLNAFIIDVTAHLEREAATSDMIDFLLDLMQDRNLREAFEWDPQRLLAERGLGAACAQDVRNARTTMINSGGVRAFDEVPPPGGDNALLEMFYTATCCTLLDRALAELLPPR